MLALRLALAPALLSGRSCIKRIIRCVVNHMPSARVFFEQALSYAPDSDKRGMICVSCACRSRSLSSCSALRVSCPQGRSPPTRRLQLPSPEPSSASTERPLTVYGSLLVEGAPSSRQRRICPAPTPRCGTQRAFSAATSRYEWGVGAAHRLRIGGQRTTRHGGSLADPGPLTPSAMEPVRAHGLPQGTRLRGTSAIRGIAHGKRLTSGTPMKATTHRGRVMPISGVRPQPRTTGR